MYIIYIIIHIIVAIKHSLIAHAYSTDTNMPVIRYYRHVDHPAFVVIRYVEQQQQQYIHGDEQRHVS